MLGRNKKPQEVTISVETIVRVVVIAALTIFAFQIIQNMTHSLTLIFVSFFLALALNPMVTSLSNKLKIKSRGGATAVAYFSVIVSLILFFGLVLPPLFSQTSDFIADIPETINELQGSDTALGRFITEQNIDQQISEFSSSWSRDISKVSNNAVSIASRIASNIVSIVTVLILTFMMLSEGPSWIKTFWRYYPEDKRSHHKKLAHKMYEVVINYVNGQVMVAGIGAAFAMIALLIMTRIFNVDDVNAIALGGIVFIFSLIPTIGTMIGSSVVVLFSAIASLPLAVAILIYFIVYQQIENASIQPIIQSKGNDLTPMLVFLSAILGIGFGGVLGAFLAIPAAGCGKILLVDWFESRDKKTKN